MDSTESSELAACLRHLLLNALPHAPLCLCTARGEIAAATPRALELLAHSAGVETPPSAVPSELWHLLEHARDGELVAFEHASAQEVLGCTRHRLASGRATGSRMSGGDSLLVLSELTRVRGALFAGMHARHVDGLSRLSASIAHHVRGDVATILYGADVLEEGGAALDGITASETVRDIGEASRRLQLIVDGLLDHAKVGPSIAVPVSLRDVLHRTQALLRAVRGEGAQRLRVDIDPELEWVRGNPVTIEQIFVNLLVSPLAAIDERARVSVRSAVPPSAGRASEASHVYVRVSVDVAELGERLFEAGPSLFGEVEGLGIVDARHAAESQGGSLILEETKSGVCIGVSLPRSEGPR